MHSQKQDIESSLGFAQISIRSDKKNRASRRKLLFQLWLNEGRSRISLHPLLYSFLVLASRINFESFPLKHRQKRSNRWRILASFPFVPRYDTSHLIERNVFPRFYRGMDTVSLVSFLPCFLPCKLSFDSTISLLTIHDSEKYPRWIGNARRQKTVETITRAGVTLGNRMNYTGAEGGIWRYPACPVIWKSNAS